MSEVHFSRMVSVGLACCIALGCSSKPARVPVPKIDAKVAGEEAIRTYDKNGDGALEPNELEDCPALLTSFQSLDSDSSKTITSNEIEARIRGWVESKAGLVSCRLRLMINGRPLQGASVLLEPASFLQPAVLPATGTTSSQGYVQLSVAEEHLPAPNLRAMNWGLYNLKITEGADGRGTIPEKLRDGTTFGIEVEAIGKNEPVLNLQSKG